MMLQIFPIGITIRGIHMPFHRLKMFVCPHPIMRRKICRKRVLFLLLFLGVSIHSIGDRLIFWGTVRYRLNGDPPNSVFFIHKNFGIEPRTVKEPEPFPLKPISYWLEKGTLCGSCIEYETLLTSSTWQEEKTKLARNKAGFLQGNQQDCKILRRWTVIDRQLVC